MDAKATKDWASIASSLADIVKCTFGTGALYDEEVLRAKIAAFRNAGISPMVGGTLTEVAILEMGGYSRLHLGDYLKYAHSLGFTHLEFSDGTIFIPDSSRGDIIKLCIDSGFTVIAEVGKKDPKKDALITRERRIELMQADLKHGVKMVIIERGNRARGSASWAKAAKWTSLNWTRSSARWAWTRR